MAITLDGTTGITTPGLTNTGTETLVNLTTTGNTILGDASTDTLNVGNGNLVTDASGNVGIGNTSPAARIDVFRSTVGTYFLGGGGDNVARQLAIKSSTTTNSGDTHTFDAQSGTGILAFATTGTERARIDTSGNLGVGTTSPSTYGRLVSLNTAGGAYAISAVGNDQSNTRIRIRNTGGADFTIVGGTPGLSNAGLAIYDETNSATRMLIDSSGNLLVGDTSAAGRVLAKSATSDGTTSSYVAKNSSGTILLDIISTGYFKTGVAANSPYNNASGSGANMVVGSDGALFRSTSSLKYKTDVQDATFGIADVLKLRAVTYKGKGIFDGNKVFAGLIAEEVHDSGLTQFVQYADDGSPDALSYGNMVSLCIKAIQEQQALITTLTARITALESA